MSSAIPAIWPIDRSALHNDHIGAFNLRRMHPVLGYIRPHKGIDLGCDRGTPVYAIADGIVSAAAAVYSYGNCVQISHGTADDGNTYDSLYAHLSSIAVSQGSAVTKGQVIGYVGNTGNVYSTGGGGYHLHLELRVNRARVNPLAYVPQ